MHSAPYQNFLHDINQGRLAQFDIFQAYQTLNQEEQLKYLQKILSMETSDWMKNKIQYNLKAVVGFLYELSEKNLLKAFHKSVMYDEFLHALFYSALDNEKEELKLKKEGIEFFEKNFNFDVKKKYSEHYETSFLHIASVQSSVGFIEFLIQKGVDIHMIDGSYESCANSALIQPKANLKAFEYLINLPSFRPLEGKNVLSHAIEVEQNGAINIILNSTLMENHSFITKAQIEHPKKAGEIVLAFNEKKKLENEISSIKTKNKMKI
jgi:hypothetical protein